MARSLRIAFVGRFYWHNGSSHALLGYARAAQRLGYDLRVSTLGIVDEIVRGMVPVAEPDWKPDVMVLIFEERFLKSESSNMIERLVPRSRRLVIDPDGHYSPPMSVGCDTNHPTDDSWAAWSGDFERLSDLILQPCLGPLPPKTRRFLYFGVDLHRRRAGMTDNRKEYDIVYVGNNWYRWHDVEWLVHSVAPARSTLGRIAIFGQYWDGDPLYGYEQHTQSDPAFLRRHQIEVYPPVPFDDVEHTMGQGRLSPVFVRPILSAIQFVTPRMFETFAADTVPLMPPYVHHATTLYGDRVRPLCLPDDPLPAVLQVLNDYSHYAALAREIGAMVASEHSYEARLGELLSLVA
jgi:hypothetical protein